MSMRMLPVSNIFYKMQRIVRDTSKKVGKDVNLVLIGEETEVDKNIIDSLSDPLMHLVRNSIDHGIESPEERAEKGKP
jgi:two-component system chemotaxis sensor kinase CheA